jgi:hypothetical protein
MTEPTLSELGMLGNTDTIELLLDGSYVAPLGTDRCMVDLLNEMRMPASI